MEFSFQSMSTITKIYRQKALWRSVMWQKRNLRQCRIFSNWDQSDRLRCSLPSKYIFDPLPSLSDYLVAEFSTMQQPTKFERLQFGDGARLFYLYWKLISQIANWEDSTKNSFHLYRNKHVICEQVFYHFSCDNGDGRVYGASLSSLAEYKNYPK